MKTFHRGISSLIENDHFYFGILKGYTIDVFNLHIPENVDILLSHKIIEVRDIANEPNSENTDILFGNVVLNNKVYSINESLIKEIIIEIGSYIQSNTEEILSDIEKIEKELYKLENPNDKVKKLEEIKNLNIDLIKHFQDYKEYEEKKQSPRIDILTSCFLSSQTDFLSSYVLQNENLIESYCLSRKHLSIKIDIKYNTTMLDEVYDAWYNWYSKGYIIKFCEKQIKEIKNNTKSNKNRVKPFELIVVLDHFRSNYGYPNFKDENIKSFLLNFNKLEIDNNFKAFKKLMECSQEDYDNISGRARLIASMTKTSIPNIRKNINKYSNSIDQVKIGKIISNLIC